MSLIVVPVAARPMPAPRGRDAADRVRARGRVAVLRAVAAIAIAASIVQPGARAAAPEIELVAAGAPLRSVLEELGAARGAGVHVADDVVDRVSGPLVGDADELLALLVATHGLSMHRDGERWWFDREAGNVVDFVPLETPMIVRALETLAAPVAPGGTVQVEASGRGLVLSGTRAYVRSSLARIARATGARVEPVTLAGVAARVPLPGLAPAVAVPPGEALADRVVLVSARAPRFVELEDGTRLAIGSRLADGRRLVGIERERLLFEDGGVETALALR